MLLRCTRSLVVPTSDRGVGVSRSSLVVPWTQQRTFKRKKLTNEDIQKAIEAKKKQRKSYLDKYYAKYQKERGDRQIASDREDLEAGIKGRDKKSKKSLNNRGDTRDMAGYRGFAKSYMNELREELADSTDPSFAERSRRKAYELHLSEPHYWTTSRLAALFKVEPGRMRASLFASKLEDEAERFGGMKFDDQLENIFAEIFGSIDIPNTYDMKPPEEFGIRKMHNPWYYLNPGIKAAELIKFTRRAEARHYRECSKIPAQHVEPVVVMEDNVPSNVPPTRSCAVGKKSYYTMVDISSHTNLYNRHIVIRESDNTFRTANWAERRRVHDSRRHIKVPYHVPFPWPDEDQLDTIPIQHKPPPSYRVYFHGEDELEKILRRRDRDARHALRSAKEQHEQNTWPSEGILMTKRV